MNKSFHYCLMLACLILGGLGLFSSCEKPEEGPKETPVQSISIVGIDNSSLSVPVKAGAQVFPIAFTPEGADVKSLSVTSSKPEVASAEIKLLNTKAVAYDAELTVTPLSGGETDITVNADGKTAVLHLTVEPETIFVITGEVSAISAGQVFCSMTMLNSDKLPAFTSYVMGGVSYSEVNTTPVVPTPKDNTTDYHDCSLSFGAVFKTGQTPVDGEYTDVPLTGLKPSTQYYYRAFVWIDESETVYYGEVKTFRTSDEPVIPAGEVDLGLSVNWWGCNIGATKPEEYGNYYAWGEIAEKDKYSVSNYMLRYSKYHTTQREEGHLETSIKIDNKTILDAEDDIATITLGEGWRMPTVEEIRELKDLNPTLYELNGVKGLLVTGKTGNSLFLPLNGCKKDNQSLYQGEHLMLWSCKASVDDALRAGAYETESQWGAVLNTYAYRFVGMGVRGVKAPRPKDGPSLKYTGFAATNITKNSATVTLTVDIDDAVVSEDGVGLQVSSDPDFKTVAAEKNFGKTGGTFTMDLTDLASSCEYYVRAYVGTLTNGLYLGEVFSFRTEDDIVEPYVDMGTSVLWASWDLGSDKPEVMGVKIAWGETQTKEEFTAENNKYYSSFNKQKGRYLYTKYNAGDKKTQLDPEDDAVVAAFGAGYRTPTFDDWAELLVHCTQSKGNRNGVEGYILTSTINGNTLFFPYPYYSSATISIRLPDDDKFYDGHYAPSLNKAMPENNTVGYWWEYMNGGSRYNGYPIRPVKLKQE